MEWRKKNRFNGYGQGMRPCQVMVLLLALCLLMIAVSAMAQGETLTVMDMKNRETSIQLPVTKLVAMMPADCEIVYALGAQEMLVGRGMDCNYPEAVEAITVVNSGMTTNVEQILALEPQVVLMNTMAQSLEQVEAIEAAGIPIVSTDTTDINGIYQAIELIGQVTGKQSEAEALAAQMEEAFTQIADKAKTRQELTVYFEVSPLQYGLWTAGKGTFLDELASLCGVRNIFADVEGWAQISQEQVLERNPDLIVSLTPETPGQLSVEQEITDRPGWDAVKAVQNKTVLVASGDEFMRPGPRLVEAAQQLDAFAQASLTTAVQ